MTKPRFDNADKASCPKCDEPISEDAPQGLCPKCVLAGAAMAPDLTSSMVEKTPPPTVKEVAPYFPELEILELIGVGGMGAVYKARQPKLDRFVALKILSNHLAKDPAFEERFSREARVLARLSHPNIVAIFDTGTTGPFAYFLMEYVDGVNLRQAMKTGGFTPSEALALTQDICAALKFAHGEGILHRDIKPENVLLDSHGQVKIADFGIAKLVGPGEADDATLTMQGAALGSPHYMAPEQFETPGDVDQRADIYSLGVVLYEMLTGELPLGRFALPSEKAALDARIDEIVLRTLAKEREIRFQTAGEVQTEVETLTGSPDVNERVDEPTNLPKSGGASPGRMFAILGVLLQLGTFPLLIVSASRYVSFFQMYSTLSAEDPGTVAEAVSRALEKDISPALVAALIAGLFDLIGKILLLVALLVNDYRAKWFYWVMMFFSILSLPSFPVGTAIGIFCLVYITKRKEEFETNRAQVSP